ncbi:MAG: isoleucine--tRNA ligase, partial [Coriobacteriales bacterium]
DGRAQILAEELVEACTSKFGWTDCELAKKPDGEVWRMKGIELAGQKYKQPIFGDQGEEGVFIYADYVTLDEGTGIVHSAPGHGVDDYNAGIKFNVPIVMPVDDDGVFYEGDGMGTGGPFSGMEVNEANPVIIDWLRERGTLIMHEDIVHSYPHCWRCHQPVIFRATNQWFVDMDANGLREKALKAINEEVRFIPEWASNRIGSMVAERPDWCISRQRSWGVPIPVFKCSKCGETVATEETFDAVIKLFSTEGADAWFTKTPAEYLPADVKCPNCGAGVEDLDPESDILDVWWESGVSHTSVCKKRPYLHFPADMYLEGSDQHRGWFQSSLLTSVGAYGVPPYKSVMHCGFTMDQNGEKMSKSKGNGIDPADVVDKYGADVLRLWVASVDYSQDVRIYDEVLKQVSDTYRRFRNTFRFLLGNLNDFDEERDSVSWDELTAIDKWALARAIKLLNDVTESYKDYKFHQVYRSVYEYVIGDLSAVYLDALKDRLYSEAPNSKARRAAQTVLFDILEIMVRILSPILSFTTEEVWQNYPEAARNRDGRPWSVQLAGWPSPDSLKPAIPDGEAESVLEGFAGVLEARDAVTKALEDARGEGLINKSQEAAVRITAPADIYDRVMAISEDDLKELFIVSEVSVEKGDELTAVIEHTDLEKCPRCWNYRELIEHDGDRVCSRCAEALDQI